ncbi:hypothetical protein H0H87_004221 [Tephrocybe sp. NHM501043]|nr:hypothetical protein H0H87_004221 [Tephrocybe sp. NHM501043]
MVFFALLVVCLAGLQLLCKTETEGTLHRREYFYVGERYTTLRSSNIASGQIYVEHLTPPKVTRPLPLLFIHGNGMTGTNFLNTPDRRPGWADYFLSKGYEVYLVDQPSRGRSPWQKDIDGAQSTFDVLTIESRFTATQLHNLWPQASLHTQWPGNGSVGDPVFDGFFASMTPSLSNATEAAMKMKAAGSALLDRIGPVILLTHSQSGQLGWILGDARPSKVRAIVALEPLGPPFTNAVFPPFSPARKYGVTDISIEYFPPASSPEEITKVAVTSSPSFRCFQQTSPPRKLVNLAYIPVLVVTSESGYHSIYDDCTVQYLEQAGVPVNHIRLEDVGIRGNGHMMFMEKNSLQIAEEVIQSWLSKKIVS